MCLSCKNVLTPQLLISIVLFYSPSSFNLATKKINYHIFIILLHETNKFKIICTKTKEKNKIGTHLDLRSLKNREN